MANSDNLSRFPQQGPQEHPPQPIVTPVSSVLSPPPGIPPAPPIPVPPALPPGVARPIPVTPIPVTAVPASEELEVTLRTEIDEETDLADAAVRSAPPFLISAIFHAVLLIVLALWVFSLPSEDRVSLEVVYAEQLGEQLDYNSL